MDRAYKSPEIELSISCSKVHRMVKNLIDSTFGSEYETTPPPPINSQSHYDI